MKKFFKNASIYILLMILIVGLIFAADYFYGRKISEDISAEIDQFAQNNGYQLNFVEVETNLLLRELNLKNINFSRGGEFNLILNEAVVNFSWQQLLNYFQKGKLEIDKNLDAKITQLYYSNLAENYQLKLDQTEISYQGKFPQNELSQINKLADLAPLLTTDHQLELRAEKLKYDFPYYRRYGLSNDDWEELSTFNDFILRADYKKEEEVFKLSQFNLSNDFLKVIFDFKAQLAYQAEAEAEADRVTLKEAQSSYDLLLAAEKINFKENDYFKELKLKQFDLSGDFKLGKAEEKLNLKELDLSFNLNNFKLELAAELSRQLNRETFGILAADNNFSFAVDKLSYDQEYTYPNGKSESQLESSLLTAEMKADYNYSQKMPYLNSAELKYKSKNSKIEQLNLFIQLLLGQRFQQNEEGYYQINLWGPIDDLNFE